MPHCTLVLGTRDIPLLFPRGPVLSSVTAPRRTPIVGMAAAPFEKLAATLRALSAEKYPGIEEKSKEYSTDAPLLINT